MTWVIYGGSRQGAMTEPNQQPNDNSIRQADSVGSEELDAAILAAVDRANEVHSIESPAETSDDYIDAGFDIVPIDPMYPFNNGELTGNIIMEPLFMGLMIDPSYNEQEDLTPQTPISEPIEEVNLPQPHPDDAVLGGQKPLGASDAVLGGIEGVKRRLASTVVEQRIAAFIDALKYGQAGLDLVIPTLNYESKSVAQGVYLQLRDSSNPLAQKALQAYNPYRFLECIFSGHSMSGNVVSIAISPDSQTLVCGTGTDIPVWNLHTGKWLHSLNGHSNPVPSLAISPDGKTLVSGSLDGIIKLWNLRTGEQLSTFNEDSTLWNHPVTSIAISPDGRTLISGSEDGTITIIRLGKLWHLHRAKRLHTLKGHSLEVKSVAISPDGRTLVSGSWDGTIKLWNLRTGEQLTTVQGYSNGVNSLAITPNGRTLISKGNDGTIKLWNLLTCVQLYTLKEHSELGNPFAISPDSQTFVTGSRDGTIKIWNLTTGEQLHTLQGHSNIITSIAISPDGHNLVSGDRDATIKVWGLR